MGESKIAKIEVEALEGEVGGKLQYRYVLCVFLH